jgi:hypothetical protein
MEERPKKVREGNEQPIGGQYYKKMIFYQFHGKKRQVITLTSGREKCKTTISLFSLYATHCGSFPFHLRSHAGSYREHG